jgi:UDP-N-acetyl-D-mannosaminuronic acid dehydrogenase
MLLTELYPNMKRKLLESKGNKMKIAVIGQGYIGLPTTLVMADSGLDIIGVDYDENKINQLQNGHVTFKEEGLEELFASAIQKNLSFQTDYPEVEMYIVAVPTPYKDDNKKVDATYLISAAEKIAEVAPHGAILVVESTISPGVIDEYIRPVLEDKGRSIGEDIHVAHAPERIIPGNMLYELYHNSRTIGADEPGIAEKVKEVYSSFCQGEIILTDIRTAEISKVVENTYRDINIAFANELSRICRRAGVDVYEVIDVANHHPRVNILSPGPGVGGHCLPIDPWFLVGDYPKDAKLIRTSREVNEEQPLFIYSLAKEKMTELGLASTAKIGLYGLTYKENVDDIRMSPSLQLLDSLDREDKARTVLYDPYVSKDLVEGQVHNLEQFINACDFIIVMVGHNELRENAEKFSKSNVFDTRRVEELKAVVESYFTI